MRETNDEDKEGQSDISSTITGLENDIPSALPEQEMDTAETVLRDLSLMSDALNPDEDEETVRIRWNPLTRVNCPQSTDFSPILRHRDSVSAAQIQREDEEKAALAAAAGFQRKSKKGDRRQLTAKKPRRQRRLLRNAVAPSRSSGQLYMEDWMPHRGGN